jgi:hypothetical protein
MTPDVRSWRRWTWLLAAWSLATLVTAIVLSGSISNTCDGLEGLGLNLCTTGIVAGTAIIWTLLGVIWLIGFLLLTLVWFARRPARRLCPPYGHPVNQGDTACRACGYDFLTGMTPAVDTGNRPGD